ncbi:biotin--[acetyl-CoA-carboxylase] ligase [Candidatus Poribacteria bacterium]|nr:biotin--[acetyl-CoA-carboxylase] ligase [Candidatus Poribacteria bacterium]
MVKHSQVKHQQTNKVSLETDDKSSTFPMTYLRETLNTELIGKSGIEYYSEVPSTNDVAKLHGKTYGAQEGKLFIAEYQTAGRGQYGRKWDAAPGKSLLVSITFTHRLKNDEVHLPNLIGALSIAQAIDIHTQLPAKIKHPNDVRINKKKVAGVLTEIQYDINKHPFFVLGFGVNVNISLDEFPDSLMKTATSLLIESKVQNGKLCRGELLYQILTNLENNYLHLKSGNMQQINSELSKLEELQ